MLSIARLRAGCEDYYLNDVGMGEDYYVGSGEAPGVWLGSAARELGLAGEVTRDELVSVLAGRSPRDGESLMGCRVSPEHRCPGFDLTLSAPKSVSLLYGLAPDEVSEAVRLAHDEAVADAIGYMEAHAAFTRRGAGGLHKIGTSGLVAAAFRQRTSRADDPQLHTHIVVANVAKGEDGRWSSLHGKLVYHQGRTAGFVYQSSLRAGLVARLGVNFEPVVNGMAEISGMPTELLRFFSTRRAEIEARMAEVGSSSRKAAAIAALETRKAKGHGPAPELVSLRERWRRQASEQGFQLSSITAVLGRPRRPTVEPEQVAEMAGQLLGSKGLTENVSSFERRQVVGAVAEALPDGARLAVVEWATDLVVGDRRVVALGVEGRGGEERLTTIEMLSIEADLLDKALRSVGTHDRAVRPTDVEQVLAGRATISEEQAAMVRQLTTSGNGLDIVVGRAGSGKTYALEAARSVWEAAGLRVQGAALAARAAAELQSGSGIASVTMARMLADLDRGDLVLGANDVVVLDEAGMVGSRGLHSLLSYTSRAGGKLVLVGDHKQLPAIEAGGALRVLASRLGAVELSENRRQAAEWEHTALEELRHGEVDAGVLAYNSHGRVHGHVSAGGARAAMVNEWAESRSSGEARMYAVRRSDVEELNGRARAALRQRGELGQDIAVAGGRSYAAGDEVLFCRNDRQLRVLNGTRGKVVSAEDGSLSVETPDGPRSVPAEYLAAGHLQHGYACTVHKSQGATIDRAFVLGSDDLYREAGYVAMSRARAGTDMYVVTPSPSGLGVPVEVVAALSTSRAKEMAIESLDATESREELLASLGIVTDGAPRHEREVCQGLGL
ncbi:MAG: MobF family relaxase [Acidimicrobiales bacterium]